ncbi:hypothetical protein GCM10009680_80460 [Streptomyces yatensis]|uniref:Transposase n=1 Tax=Streptomyces yatensis TaxID=155177 RepID=A0ABP4VLD1_9ACTN
MPPRLGAIRYETVSYWKIFARLLADGRRRGPGRGPGEGAREKVVKATARGIRAHFRPGRSRASMGLVRGRRQGASR